MCHFYFLKFFHNSTNFVLFRNWTYLDISEVGTLIESLNDHLTLKYINI